MPNVYPYPPNDQDALSGTAEINQFSSDHSRPAGDVIDLDTERQRRLQVNLRKGEALKDQEPTQGEYIDSEVLISQVAEAAQSVVRMRTGVSAAGGEIPFR